MDESREKKVTEIKDRIERGEYQVDPVAVAGAILQRLRDAAVAHADQTSERRARGGPDGSVAQSECSYPESRASSLPKLTAGVPATTRPIQVREALLLLLDRVFSISPRATGAAQTHSS